MTKSNMVTAACVFCSLIGVYKALTHCPLKSVLIPWFAIPAAAILVFWPHGSAPSVSPYRIIDTVTERTLRDIQDYCGSYRSGVAAADRLAATLFRQAEAFRRLTGDMEEVFSLRFGSGVLDSYRATTDRCRDGFLDNSARAVNRLRTVSSAAYAGLNITADVKLIRRLVSENDRALTELKDVVDLVSDFKL